MNNYHEDVDLKKLVALVNISEGSLCRFFKNNMGITLFEYLNQIRTEFACKLLMDLDLSISEVSRDAIDLCGSAWFETSVAAKFGHFAK